METEETPQAEEKSFDPTAHMLNLKGKLYLPVAARVVWFRRDFPIESGWGIETKLLDGSFEKGFAVYEAIITDSTGRVIGSATNVEDRAGFGDFMQKAETSAVGRALAFCGYGTMGALDEGEVVDSPIQRGPNAQTRHTPSPPPSRPNGAPPLAQQPRERPADSLVEAPRLSSETPRVVEEQPERADGDSAACSIPGCSNVLTKGQAMVSNKQYGKMICLQHRQKIAANPAV